MEQEPSGDQIRQLEEQLKAAKERKRQEAKAMLSNRDSDPQKEMFILILVFTGVIFTKFLFFAWRNAVTASDSFENGFQTGMQRCK